MSVSKHAKLATYDQNQSELFLLNPDSICLILMAADFVDIFNFIMTCKRAAEVTSGRHFWVALLKLLCGKELEFDSFPWATPLFTDPKRELYYLYTHFYCGCCMLLITSYPSRKTFYIASRKQDPSLSIPRQTRICNLCIRSPDTCLSINQCKLLGLKREDLEYIPYLGGKRNRQYIYVFVQFYAVITFGDSWDSRVDTIMARIRSKYV
jgi:hypothetical protein